MKTHSWLIIPLLLGSLHCARRVRSLNVYDGFETGEPSQCWDTSRVAPGALTMQADVVRSGHRAAKIVLHSHDRFEAGVKGDADSERDELAEADALISVANATYEYSFSLYVPSDFPIVPTRLILAQWKQKCPAAIFTTRHCSNDSPVVAVRYQSGVLRITQQTGSRRATLFETRENVRGRWTDFRFRIRFATDRSGLIEAWIDDRQVVEYRGATAYPENMTTGYRTPSAFYFKMGLYRDVMAAPMTIYIDEYRKRRLSV